MAAKLRSEQSTPAVVIDQGSGFCKLGLSGDRAPRSVLHTVVARDGDQVKVLEEAWGSRGTLPVEWPIQRGTVSDWDAMEKIWEHCYSKELKVNATEHPVLLTEHPNPSKSDREKMTQIILEKFGAPSMFLAFKPVLSLYSAGRYDGLVLQMGYGATHAAPCYQGNPLNKESIRLNLGGCDLDGFMKKLLEKKGTVIDDIDNLNSLKESVCSVALNFDEQVASAAPKTFKLPDGAEVSVTDEQFRCPEALFQPSLVEQDSAGIHQMVHNAVMQCEEAIRKKLFSNIVVTGGTALLPGVADRLKKELEALVDPSFKVGLIDTTVPKTSAFIGASILTSLESFESIWLTKKEYEEAGPAIVHKKFV